MDYKEVIESKYNRVAWEEFLYDIFKSKARFFTTPAPVNVNQNVAEQAHYIGIITLADNQRIAVYEVLLSPKVQIDRNKVSIRNLLVSEWRNSGFAGAFMFCYRTGGSELRFSYVSETYSFGKDGKYEKVSTNTKRYTYLLGQGHGCRTAIDQFKTLRDSQQTLNDITKAFSVEALTKQFYNELFDWYCWAISENSGISFPNNTTTEEDDHENIETKIIRLITRIMFVWFIKQKNLIPNKLFDTEYLKTILKDFNPEDSHTGSFYNAILQNLFFATLNRAIEDEDGTTRGFAHASKKDIKNLYRYAEMFNISEQQVVDMFSSVPFLNGGLFECLDKTKTMDGVKTAFNYDGFSRNESRFPDGRYRNRAVIPNMFFFAPEKGLLSILNRYNFTIEENTPDEQQVALDPELLGKVFENLLGAYNPETKETARKQSGSFYTPREIVNYMVDESLIAYLGDNEITRSVFKNEFTYNKSDEPCYLTITDKLKNIKVLDPACGSGAFPMGVLNRIVDVLRKLNGNETLYDLKLHIIENCIYGSDIQSIAAQITKLRFFISLICDCEKDNGKPNFGMPTLPNLETKFVSSDTLIKIKKIISHNLFENPQIEEKKNELKQVRHEHFMAKTAESKTALRKQDELLRKDLASLIANSEVKPEDSMQLITWNPYDQNEVSHFFDSEWMFGITDGFDIVIGNPPYIQLQNNSGALAQKYVDEDYATYARTGDIYCLFYERGWELLKDGGHLCYITSNKWMRAGYGEKTRAFFAKKTNPMLLIDFAGVKIFDSVTVDTNVLLFAKSANEKSTVCAVTNKNNKDSINNLSLFVQQEHSACTFSSSDSWVILSPIEQSIKHKIEAVGTPLKDWDINIYRGVLTGCNEAFIISTEKRDEILANCQTENEHLRTAELIRPILRGRDIKRYGYEWANLWIIATFPSKHYDIESYPAVKDYLLSIGIERLEQTGDTHIVNGEKIKARKKTNNKWFETQDSISYWEDFSKPKIVWGEISDRSKFAYESGCKFIPEATTFLMVGNHLSYLFCFLNSPLSEWFFSKVGTTTGVGTVRWKKYTIQQLILPVVIDKQQNVFNDYVGRYIKGTLSVCNFAKKVNTEIYKLVGLTDMEIDYVEHFYPPLI